MNSALLINIARFIILILAQVAIFNNLNFIGYLNPYPYILFIILYPVNANKNGLILASFFLGLTMDMFSNSGGVHTTACLTLAFLRPSFFRFSFGLSYEYQTIKISDRFSPGRFSFILTSVITHHLILFILEIFKFSFIFDILLRTLVSTIFTLVLCIIIIYIIKPSRN